LIVILITAACAGRIGSAPSGNTDGDGLNRDSAGDTTVYTESQVEKKAAVREPLTAFPKYPSDLEQTGVSGEVQAEFVVDRAGYVEMATFRVLRSTHPAFVNAVRAVLPRVRFVPAEIRDRRVRQIAKQSFQFRSQLARQIRGTRWRL
jgi:outer membrane biosynthesis protein TonB